MTQKLLLIRRIQTDFDWDDDALKIGYRIVKILNYDFPHPEYNDLFAALLRNYITEEISSEVGLEELFYELFRRGHDEICYHKEDCEKKLPQDYYEFELTREDLAKIDLLIIKETKKFYQEEKLDLLAKLNNLPKDTVIIYPYRFYANILKKFYAHNHPIFYSAYNNDNQCIDEYLSKANVDDYEAIEL